MRNGIPFVEVHTSIPAFWFDVLTRVIPAAGAMLVASFQVYAAGDLTRQEPVVVNVELGNKKNALQEGRSG